MKMLSKENKWIWYVVIAFVSVNLLICLCYSMGSARLRKDTPFPEFMLVKKKMVGFLQMATGKYTRYLKRSHDSFINYMFVNSSTHDYRILYYTDQAEAVTSLNSPKAIHISQERLQWPYDSMNRNEVYLKNRQLLEDFDYIIALDLDLVWVNHVEPELILGDFITLIHVGFTENDVKVKGKGSFVNDFKCQAFVPVVKQQECYYIMGGFFGGTTENFFKALETMEEWKAIDEKNDVIPRWHDESYLNRYVCDNYRYGDEGINFIESVFFRKETDEVTSTDTKVIHMEKNHKEIRDLV